MMFYYGEQASGWGWLLMILGMVAFWGLLITSFWLLIRSPGSRAQLSGEPPTPQTPEQLLGLRFARGEIDESEYTSRLVALHAQVRS